MADFDPARHKREERAGYNLIAARYAAAAPSRARLNEALLDAAGLGPGLRVLDVASGPGVLAGAAALRVPGGLVLASDLAEGALAQSQARQDGVLCAAADAECLGFAGTAFDRVLCGLGLMFFPHAEAALAEMRRVLAPGGLLALSVWGAEARVPLVACALQCLRRLLPPPKQARLSPFRFGDAALLRLTLQEAGFAEVTVTPHALDCTFADPAAYWQGFRDLAGGAALALSRLPAELLARLPGELARELAPHRHGAGYLLSSEVLIAAARKPAQPHPHP